MGDGEKRSVNSEYNSSKSLLVDLSPKLGLVEKEGRVATRSQNHLQSPATVSVHEAAVNNSAKPNSFKQDAVKQDAVKQDAVKQDAVKQDAVKQNTVKQDTKSKLHAPRVVASLNEEPAPADAELKGRKAVKASLLSSEKSPGKRSSNATLGLGIDKGLEGKLQTLLDDYEVADAGVVVLRLSDGKIAAAAGRILGKGRHDSSVLTPRWPAASLIKVLTADLLLSAGLNTKTKECFDGGFRRLSLRDVQRNTGGTCASLATAFGRSYNVPFARWSLRHLSVDQFQAGLANLGFRKDNKFGLNAKAYEMGAGISKLEFANVVTGFAHIPISAVHAAFLASLVARDGSSFLPSRISEPRGREVRWTTKSNAGQLKVMMRETVRNGSATTAFRKDSGAKWAVRECAGKTGSLAVKGRDLSWFVGFAPYENPQYAVASYAANEAEWRIRATYIGKQALRAAVLKSSPYRPIHDRWYRERRANREKLTVR